MKNERVYYCHCGEKKKKNLRFKIPESHSCHSLVRDTISSSRIAFNAETRPNDWVKRWSQGRPRDQAQTPAQQFYVGNPKYICHKVMDYEIWQDSILHFSCLLKHTMRMSDPVSLLSSISSSWCFRSSVARCWMALSSTCLSHLITAVVKLQSCKMNGSGSRFFCLASRLMVLSPLIWSTYQTANSHVDDFQ